MSKQTLKQIREESTRWAKAQAAIEAKNPELKRLMDELREAEAVFFASQY
ncbi:MAG: hypothetical protein IPK63_18040 [Candidatus Competibacteraceae bacterium]|nr:hypothetical protein [Candidatus Competibacteraceae bacterium]